jgi:hypothetical protein
MPRTVLPLLLLAAFAAGCAGSRGPDLVTISGSEYDLAFATAVDVVRGMGMPAELIDRRTGVLETEYRTAGTIVEPWRSDSSTLGGAIESTINHERRKARIEFTPVRFEERAAAENQLTGPDLVGERVEVVDLTGYDGRIEVRAWVQIERSTAIGRRRGDWTRRSTTVAIDPNSGLGRAQTFWTPVTRDSALERRLLRQIEDAVGEGRSTASIDHEQNG